jgi:hypothetical protein
MAVKISYLPLTATGCFLGASGNRCIEKGIAGKEEENEDHEKYYLLGLVGLSEESSGERFFGERNIWPRWG